jgi:DNA-binding NarL/FixJ family response regulator
MSVRVLVADDQSMVRVGFRMRLANEPGVEVVTKASSGLEALTSPSGSSSCRHSTWTSPSTRR